MTRDPRSETVWIVRYDSYQGTGTLDEFSTKKKAMECARAAIANPAFATFSAVWIEKITTTTERPFEWNRR